MYIITDHFNLSSLSTTELGRLYRLLLRMLASPNIAPQTRQQLYSAIKYVGLELQARRD